MRVGVLFVLALSAGASASAAPRPPFKSRIAPKVQQAQQAGGELARKARSDAASAASAAGASIHRALDDDGDGEVSVADFERTLERISRWCATRWKRGVRFVRRHRRACLVLAGALGLTHGDKFAYTVLVARTFRASGWPIMREGFEHARDAYAEARDNRPNDAEVARRRAACEMQFDALQAELVATRRRRKKKRLGKARAALRREEEALLARIREVRAQHDALAAASPPVRSVLLRAACDPIVLRDVAVGLASGASASLAAATSDAARSLGIGLTLGDAVARACGWAEHLARRALSGLPADAVALGSAATARTGTRALVQLGGRLSGCYLAFRLQSLAMTLSVCLLSARALTAGLAAPGDDADGAADDDAGAAAITAERATAVWALALCGLAGQRAGVFAMPILLRVALLPAFAAEHALRHLGVRVQSGSIAEAVRAARGNS